MTVLIEDHGLPLISIGEPRRHRMTVEPSTEAGQMLADLALRLAKAQPFGRPDSIVEINPQFLADQILAIESEARAAALREVTEKVRGLRDGLDDPLTRGLSTRQVGSLQGQRAALSYVLRAILTEATDTSATRAVGASE